MRTCTVCSWPPRTVGAINKGLLAGMTLTAVARKYSRPNRPISVSAIRRHSLHVLSSGQVGKGNRNALPGADVSGVSSKSLLERVEALSWRWPARPTACPAFRGWRGSRAAATAAMICPLLVAVSASPSCLVMINFYAIDITESRIKEFFDAAKFKVPQLSNYVKEQVTEHFGYTPPKVQINFVGRPGLSMGKQFITGKDSKQIEATVPSSAP